MRVQVTDAPPRDAYASAQYNKRWFWIADNVDPGLYIDHAPWQHNVFELSAI